MSSSVFYTYSLDPVPSAGAQVGFDGAVSEPSFPCQLEPTVDYPRAELLSQESYTIGHTSPSTGTASPDAPPSPGTPPAKNNPRIANGFILFRKHFVKVSGIPKDVENRQERLSRVAGQAWQMLSEEEKSVWKKLSEALVKRRMAYTTFYQYDYYKHLRSSVRRKEQDPALTEKAEFDRASRLRERFTRFKGPAKPSSKRRTTRKSLHSSYNAGLVNSYPVPMQEETRLASPQLDAQTPSHQYAVLDCASEVVDFGHNETFTDAMDSRSDHHVEDTAITSFEMYEGECFTPLQNPQAGYAQANEQINWEPVTEEQTAAMQSDAQFGTFDFSTLDTSFWNLFEGDRSSEADFYSTDRPFEALSFEGDQRLGADFYSTDRPLEPLGFEGFDSSAWNYCTRDQGSEYLPEGGTISNLPVVANSDQIWWESFQTQTASDVGSHYQNSTLQHLNQPSQAVGFLPLGGADRFGTTTFEGGFSSERSGTCTTSDALDVQADWDMQSSNAMVDWEA